jgi:hypothetical protein
MTPRPASTAASTIGSEIVVARVRLERIRALLDMQERQFMNLEGRGPVTAGDAAAQRLRAMKQAGI